jgi:hypothetical protein
VGIPEVEKYMETYVLGSGAAMPSPFADPAPPAPDGSVGIDSALLATPWPGKPPPAVSAPPRYST